MIKVRKSEERGSVDHGWLKAKHAFSFASYQDPKHKHFGPLVVINQDIISAGSGFPNHPHENMEILTYIISGELSHEDNTGAGSTIYPNKVQRMSAGSGIVHSEFNQSDQETELLQIWILPEEKDINPGYEEQEFNSVKAIDNLQLLASGNSSKALKINRDINVYRSFLGINNDIDFKAQKKYQWIQLISGSIKIKGHKLKSGDAIGMQDEGPFTIEAEEKAHFLLFDMN